MKNIFMDRNYRSNYIFGCYVEEITSEDLAYIFSLALQKKNNLLKIPTKSILEVIDKVNKMLLNSNDEFYSFVFENLGNIGFSKKMIKLAIIELAKIFTYENMKKRIVLEMGDFEIFDKFVGEDIKIRAFPVGILVHITAGNVFVSAIDSLLNGILTKNLNIIKTSSKVGNFFGILWIKLLKKAEEELSLNGLISDNIVIFSYKSEDLMNYINKYSDGLVVWGSYDTIKYFSANFDPRKKLILFGPKYSIAVIDDSTLLENLDNEEFYNKLVWDICLWEQRACSSVQTIYLIGNLKNSDVESFASKLSYSLKNFEIEQGELTIDEYTEIFKYEEISMANQILNHGKYFNRVYWDYNKYTFFIGPLNRFVCIKTLKNIEELKYSLKEYSDILQSCSIMVKDKENFIENLAQCGITRFVELGKIGFSEIFAPHEGEYVLRKFAKLVSLSF